ncbi:legume-like lectin family-domain-containing protein [Lobosporangium transversale]|uniref:Legume-like lectin family-domain-containing protein n=1 Tax=Lobosporangium transversale TaxID=64571 RepID=A0A1Y2GYE1_9FUNG|nr:legume-like lectin family-domain-containing protein [Lobosporangium transversale]ORZ27309.1 legume-like lectin family-domain-containing protein [Lobosporangium transversale]|eukprot:XP_021885036.1 legume-like lectin family-domain-containing protein [Lobosporangium transversale]
MKSASILLIPIVFLSTIVLAAGDSNETPHSKAFETVQPAQNRRYDYKQSMKKPFMYNGAIPFWEHHGNSFVALEFVRLAPSVPGLHGSVWRSTPNEHKEWEVEFSFKAHGQHSQGGRGLAFWYTQDYATEGSIFGNKDKWKGIGIFLDTNDVANQRLTPVVYGLLNDGTKAFPSRPIANSIGGCFRDYKNSPGPVVVRVSYVGKKLRVALDSFGRGTRMIDCFEVEDVDLPTGYHFGFSSSESGASDDHDLYSFEVYEVNPAPKTEKYLRPHEAEVIKKSGEIKIDEEDKRIFEDAQVAAAVSDTQFRIIESLNSIHNKLESLGAPVQPPESTTKNLAEINAKIQAMTSSLHTMEGVVEGLVKHVMSQGGVSTVPDITKVLKDELKNLNAKMEDIDVSVALSLIRPFIYIYKTALTLAMLCIHDVHLIVSSII